MRNEVVENVADRMQVAPSLIRRLRDQGVPVVLITHTMPDVFAVADRVVVMHRGRKVTEKAAASTDAAELVQYMVGALDDELV